MWSLDGRRARRVGPAGDHEPLWRRILDDINIALCAELVGTAERALELAVEYAKVRVQFDRPIATFQVIKHKAADMLHHLELARVGTHYAAWASDADDPERERAAAMCKGYVAEAADAVTAECIQVHGGVGFTWDVDCHLLYRRAKQDDLLFGAQGFQRQRLADLLLGPAARRSRSAARRRRGSAGAPSGKVAPRGAGKPGRHVTLCAQGADMTIGAATIAFVAGAVVCLGTSWVFVSKLEMMGERFGYSEASLGLLAALAADTPEITAAVTASPVTNAPSGPVSSSARTSSTSPPCSVWGRWWQVDSISIAKSSSSGAPWPSGWRWSV